MGGIVEAKDFLAVAYEEDFRIGLSRRIIFCNVLNKIHPGTVLKGGKTARIVNCVVASKSSSEWKQGGGCGLWKYGGNVKSPSAAKPFVRKNVEPFITSNSMNSSVSEKSAESLTNNDDIGIYSSYRLKTTTTDMPLSGLSKSLSEVCSEEIQALKHTIQTAKENIQVLQMAYQEARNHLGNIRVYCRVRPFLPGQSSHSSTVDNIEEGTFTVIAPSKYGKEGKKSFTFNKVFGPFATQVEVFADTQPPVWSILDGNSSQNGINVPDANRLPVSSTSDAISLMNLGQKNRVVSATALNDRSIHSHSCLTIHVHGRVIWIYSSRLYASG
ncbi:hypothetical protein Nepgr_001598 [Nepenthes gracilis]|uniref:Kinesin motor domain-containing protein n=1 Tax=Nepenthes gracilis TaxID=150966 RepID=A0AAD3P4Q6_NEPGR|nr:hypothetical protein Nepgr_001598 [Nepenthes gracilis]